MTDRTELTPEKLAELRRLAENATPGAWEAIIFDSGHSKFEFEASVCTQDVGDSICRMDGLLRTAVNERYRTDGSLDAMFIAAANPAAVLGLLDEVERLTTVVRRVRELHRESHGSLSALYPNPICECGKDYPCPTIRALDGVA